MERSQEATGEVAACGDLSVLGTPGQWDLGMEVLDTDQLNHQLMASVAKEARLHLLTSCLNS